MSSHLGNPKAGKMDQWVDTNDRAWAEADYNSVGISVENEGNSGDSLTPSQLENAAQALAWAHATHGTKLQITNNGDTGEGVIGHGQLGVAGGNHPDCPGAPILAQRQAIVDRAIQILGAAAPPPPVPSSAHPSYPGYVMLYTSGVAPRYDSNAKVWQQHMRDRGWTIGVDGFYGPECERVCKAFQADSTAHGWWLSEDGELGPNTWRATWERPISR